MDFYFYIEINELVYFLVLCIRVSSRTRGDCYPRTLFFLIWGVTKVTKLIQGSVEVYKIFKKKNNMNWEKFRKANNQQQG
jgi:hypothetical protein